MDIVDIIKIKKACQTIWKHIKKTLLKRSTFFSQFCDGNVFLKLENQQIQH